MEKNNPILLSEPLARISNPAVYQEYSARAAEVEVWSDAGYHPLNDASRQILINYAYIIYEFLDLNNTVEIDYRTVKKFAKKYRSMLDYIFDISEMRQKLDSWLQEEVEMAEMAMYMPTDRYNKNAYH